MTPNTTVTLYATPFDISNKYVIAANSPGEALGIVSSYPSKVYTDCYWQRDNDFVFRANGNINEVEQYNYCVYVNNGRYNFAFITECDYVNDAMTLVHLALDPWLNFAGQYVFHDSPMVRCHVSEEYDRLYTSGTVEPVTVSRWRETYDYFGDPTSYGTYKVLVVTKVPPANFDSTTVATFYNAVNDLINNGAPAAMTSYWTQIQEGMTTIVNIHPQAATTICTMSELAELVHNFMINGRGSDIIGAYYVPECCLNDISSGYKSTIQPKRETLSLNIGTNRQYWYKGSYSPQFKRVYINNCGNTHYLPVDEISRIYTANPMANEPFRIIIGIDPSMNGRIICFVDAFGGLVGQQPPILNYQEHIVPSMPWDKVQITGYGVDVFQQSMNQLQSGKIAYYGASNALSNLLSLDLTGVVDAAADTAFAGLENLINANQIMKSGSFATASGSTSMATYNMTGYLVKFGVLTPFNDFHIYKMFGTYGYTMDGEVLPIVFKALPYWTYYQTQTASIEGRSVPQRYLNQIIQRFNSGIFVFNDTASYKDFSKALDNHY